MVSSTHKPATRLWGIVARKAPRVVIFRRGPTRQVALVSWHTDTHEFFLGQWLKARVFERRSDLSPSGEKLIYFASDYGRDMTTWTAVSRPPFFKAVLLWPKGDSWGGGGMFDTERRIRLNHPPFQKKLGPDWELPKNIDVELFGKHSGGGEDEPIHSALLLRDGWELIQKGKWVPKGRAGKVRYENAENEIWARSRGHWTIERRASGVFEQDGPKYVLRHRVLDKNGELALDLGRSDWCDWSYSGEILLAKDGCLHRIRVTPQRGVGGIDTLIDLRLLRFEPVVAPVAAAKWGGEPLVGRSIE